jgi:hypothetical protein
LTIDPHWQNVNEALFFSQLKDLPNTTAMAMLLADNLVGISNVWHARFLIIFGCETPIIKKQKFIL